MAPSVARSNPEPAPLSSMRIVIETRDRRGHQIGEADLLCEPHARAMLAVLAPTLDWPKPWQHSSSTWNAQRTEQTIVRVLRQDTDQLCRICTMPTDQMLPKELPAAQARDAVAAAFDRLQLRRDLETQIAYGVQCLKGEEPVELDAWPTQARADLKYATEALINRFDGQARRAGELRAREAVASLYGGDYSALSPFTQGRINEAVRLALKAYEIALEGLSEPIAPSRAAELSPETRPDGRTS
jgi:hypothetical protein